METEIGWEKKIRKRVAVEDIVSYLIKTVSALFYLSNHMFSYL